MIEMSSLQKGIGDKLKRGLLFEVICVTCFVLISWKWVNLSSFPVRGGAKKRA